MTRVGLIAAGLPTDAGVGGAIDWLGSSVIAPGKSFGASDGELVSWLKSVKSTTCTSSMGAASLSSATRQPPS